MPKKRRRESQDLRNTFEKGLYNDSIPSLQPDGTYRDAWAATNETDNESGFGVANENSNEKYISLPPGFEVRGLIYCEERDQYIVMLLHSSGLSEIGILDEKHKTYTKVVNDDDLSDGNLEFSQDEWINMELKVEQPCNELHLYWSNKYWYMYINLDDKCKDYSIAKFRLFRCICGPTQKVQVLNGGGEGVPNGAYQFVAQLEDADHNKTNWFNFTNPVYVAQKGFKAGEPTNKSIRLELSDLDKEYTKVNIALVKTIGGIQFPPEIIFKANYGSSKITLDYTGQSGEVIDLDEIQIKNPTYIKGRNLIQKDGSLILYNLKGETNIHYQPLANQVKVEYVVGLVPAAEAHLVPTMRGDENYILGGRLVYCDGTESADFVFNPGEPTAADLATSPASQNCQNCDLPAWATGNTSERTWQDDSFFNEKEVSVNSSHTADAEYDKPKQEIETVETVKLPPSLEEVLKQNPKDQTAGICDCIKQHIKGTVFQYEEGFLADDDPESTFVFNLTIGPEEECCKKLQDTATGNGGGLADGLNELLGSYNNSNDGTGNPTGGNNGGTGRTNRPLPGSNGGGDDDDVVPQCVDFDCDGGCPDGCDCNPLINKCSGTYNGPRHSLSTIPEDGESSTENYSPSTEGVDLDSLLNYTAPTTNTFSKSHDFTLPVFGGGDFSIQEKLDAGKAVILDFFTTWCGPCKTVFDASVFDTINSEYGPASANYKVDVIGIEMDQYTTDSDLDGSGANTLGDYTTASYPLVNLGSAEIDLLTEITNAYSVQYYPFAVIIYPDGKTFNIGSLNVPTVVGFLMDPILSGASNTSSGGNSGSSPTGGGSCTSCGGSGGTCGSGASGAGGSCSGNSTGGGCGGGGGCSGSCGTSAGGRCSTPGQCGNYGDLKNLCSYCGSCGNPAGDGGACFSCNGDYCRHVCYEKPQTYLDAISRLLRHRVVTYKAAKFYRKYDGPQTPNDNIRKVPSDDVVDIRDGIDGIGGGNAQGLSAGIAPSPPPTSSKKKYAKILVYDEDGCGIIEKQYPIVARGRLGYWESSEIYPLTTNCGEDGKPFYIWGDLAGKPVRAFRMPTRNQEPHFVSYNEGVIHNKDLGNYELQDTWTRHIWLEFSNIQKPSEDMLSKPLCPNTPFRITYIKRVASNKRILASGLFTGTFKGDYFGRDFAFPKHAVNSLEYVDRYVASGADNQSHLGTSMDIGAYNFHSPDTSFDRPFLPVDQIGIDLEIFGKGYRHGLYALEKEPDNPFKGEIDQRGTRQTINLNKYMDPMDNRIHCVSGYTYAEADTVCEAADGMTYPLSNMHHESSVYLQLSNKSGIIGQDRLRLNPINTIGNPADADDASFVGDGRDHECPVRKAAGWYGCLINYKKDQYGSIEGAPFIPMGLDLSKEDFEAGTITGIVGDAWISPFTLVRKSYISNKVGNESFADTTVLPILRNLACMGDCSKLPNSGNANDAKNLKNLQPTKACWDGSAGALTRATTDVYFPRTLKSLIITWVESDTNGWYRQLGEKKEFEVYYPQMESIPIDSTMTGLHYDESFLNQFAEKHFRIPKWKLVLKPIIRLLAFFVPWFWFFKDGFTWNNDYTDWILWAIRLVLTLAFWVILFFVIFTCSNLNKFLSIRVCKTDAEGGQDDNNIYGFRDNYARYNYDYSLQNDLEIGYSMDSTYDVRKCLGEENNKIVYSNKQRIGSPINAWRNFKVNNYLDLPAESGLLKKIFLVGNKMFLHTTDMIWNVFTDKSELKLQNDSSVYLGRGDLMSNAQPIMGGIIEGVYGLSDPNAAYTFQGGYIFPDREARKWYIFNGQEVNDISDLGLHHFFKNNFDFKLLEQFPDFTNIDLKNPNGIGYAFGVNHGQGLIYLTKIDYEAKNPGGLSVSGGKLMSGSSEVNLKDTSKFINRSFTVSFSMKDRDKLAWVSKHYFTPLIYAWNRFDMYSFGKEEGSDDLDLWRHNKKGEYQKFYGTYYPHVIEFVTKNGSTFDNFQYTATELDTECEQWNGAQYIKGKQTTFDKVAMYNSHQSSGLLPFVNQKKRSILENTIQDFSQVQIDFNNRKWEFAAVKDRLIDPDEAILDIEPEEEIGIVKFNETNHGKPLLENNLFEDNHIVYRLVFDNPENSDKKILTKMVITDVENNTK